MLRRAPKAPKMPLRCVEMRTYFVASGRLPALHGRFREHTRALFAKHGIVNLGYFTPAQQEEAGGGDVQRRLVYFIGAPSREARDAGFAAFAEDPDWVSAKAASEMAGPLVDRIESVFLEPASWSPAVGELGREGHVLEMRRYCAAPGKGGVLNGRFRDHSMAAFEKHGLSNVAYFSPVDADGEVWFLLAHPSQAAAAAAYDRLHADPTDVAFKAREKAVYGDVIGAVESEFLSPTDYNPQLPPSGGQLRHVVSFRFKPDISEDAKQALCSAFAGLPSQVPAIRAFEWGLNCSPEGKGFTHVFMLTFDSEAARDAYLPHPAHKAFGATYVRPAVADVLVVDFWSHDSRYVVTPPTLGDASLRHLVCYAFGTGVSESDRNGHAAGFGELQAASQLIHSFEWGTQNSLEGKAHGLSHCFLLSFGTEADRDAYLPSTEHQAFRAQQVPADTLVLDWLPVAFCRSQRHHTPSDNLVMPNGGGNYGGGDSVGLSEAQRCQFMEQGYVVCHNVFSDDDFVPLQHSINTVMDTAIDAAVSAGRASEANAYRGAPFATRLALIHAADETLGLELVTHIYNMVAQGGDGNELLQILRHPSLLSLVRDLVGPDILGSSVYRIRPKLPHYERGEVPFHQDSGYTMAHCDQLLVVTAWIPLVDANVENGCMYVIPWQFKDGIMPHYTGGKAGYLEIKEQDLPQTRERIPMEVAAGDILLLNNLSPHASFTNSSETVRWSLDLRFSDPTVVSTTMLIRSCDCRPVSILLALQ
eukprot:COSAG01_NODE_8243_length_2858_cov_7.332004_1_plen_759_part_00